MQRSRGFGHRVVVSKKCYNVLQTKLLASAGWKRGCEHFSCRCSQHVTTCHFRNPFPPSFLEFQACTPYQKLELPESRVRSAISALNHGCIMPIPSLQLQKKTNHMQRSRGFGHGVVVSKICYNTVFVLSVVLCECCQPMNTCRDWGFSNSGLEVGLPSRRCSQNVTRCRKEICCTCLSKEPIPATLLWNSKHSTYQKLVVPESPSAFRHLCIKWWHHAHPFVAAAEKTCHMRRSRGFGHGVVSKELLHYSL